jgi:hypothetical protein
MMGKDGKINNCFPSNRRQHVSDFLFATGFARSKRFPIFVDFWQ